MRTRMLLLSSLLACGLEAAPRLVEMPGQSPLVTLRVVFHTGAASDPAAKPGLAHLTASMLSRGGTKQLSYDQIVETFFPMAVSVSAQVDKEMTTFTAATHVDNLEAFYKVFRAMLLEPGWRPEDLKRLRDDSVNFLRVTLRGNNDEELGKEVLYNAIYQGHPYGRHNAGTVSGLNSITLEDLQRFYRENYTQARAVIGISGGYPETFPARLRKDFGLLAQSKAEPPKRPQPPPIKGIRLEMIEKQTRSVAYSFGFPIDVRRGHADFIPLLVAQSYFGQHRMSGGRLYERMRQVRGLNYGDYAYIEYFPNGMFQLEPNPNLARPQQIFQVWVRPVEPPTAHFALRLAMYELDKLVRDGLNEEQFQRTRSFLTKYVNLLMKTKSAELGYAIDSLYYGIPEFGAYVREGLKKTTLEDVNRAIRKHLRTDNLYIAVIASGCEQLKKSILENSPSPMTYNSPKPEELLKEDKVVEKWKLDIRPEAVRITPVERVFE